MNKCMKRHIIRTHHSPFTFLVIIILLPNRNKGRETIEVKKNTNDEKDYGYVLSNDNENGNKE